MMLAHFGETEAAGAIERGIEEVLAHPECRTPYVGGKATKKIVGKAIADTLSKWCGKMAKNSEGTFWVSS